MSEVYFVQVGAEGPIKIGYSRFVRGRLEALNSACPYPLVLLATIAGGLAEEQAIHRLLSAHRFKLEWFNPHPDVLAVVQAARTGARPWRVLHSAPPSHTDIVARIGADKLATLRSVSPHTVRSWATRNSIPAEHWEALRVADLASLEELAAAAAAKATPADAAPIGRAA